MRATDELRKMLDEADEYYKTSGNKTWWGRPIDMQTGKPINVFHYQAQPMGEDRLFVELLNENAKLRELCADMYGFIKRMDEDCGDVTFSDCFDYCKHDTADDGCCKTGECWYEQRLRELGIEVEG